jgi:PAS domain S-box-containing protein
MKKDQYIQKELFILSRSFGTWLISIGVAAILGLSVLDYFATPENFLKFFLLRTGAASLLGAFWAVLRSAKRMVSQLICMHSAAIVTAAMIEMMILSLGGDTSEYFAGMIVLYIIVLGFVPGSVKSTAILSFFIYLIYPLPILLFDPIIDARLFITHNIFLVVSAVSANFCRHYIYKAHVEKMSLEYDLAEERKISEKWYDEALKNSEEKYESLVENVNIGIYRNTGDPNGQFIQSNPALAKIFGYDDVEEFKTVSTADLYHDPEDRQRFIEALGRQGSVKDELLHLKKKDGTTIIGSVTAKAQYNEQGDILWIDGVIEDVTEQRRLQEQLLHSQKMESVGLLAGGIAHNFNNELATILGYSEILLEFEDLDKSAREKVVSIEKTARKVEVMVSKLLRFARREEHRVVTMEFNDIVTDTVKLFRGVLHAKYKIKLNLEGGILIKGDPDQIEQIIMNLMVNARDAMPDGGHVTIKTCIAKGEDGFSPDGDYGMLMVSDTGCGIPEKIINRIFDPFFTTKEPGKGTGLGLATVYGIVKDHGGHISVRSEEGKGTSFHIYLPVAESFQSRTEEESRRTDNIPLN